MQSQIAESTQACDVQFRTVDKQAVDFAIVFRKALPPSSSRNWASKNAPIIQIESVASLNRAAATIAKTIRISVKAQ